MSSRVAWSASAAVVMLLSTAAGASTTLQVWQMSLRPRAAEQIAREFERHHPGVRVAVASQSWEDGFEKLVLAVASRSEPDVFELGSTWIPQFREAGVLAELDRVDPVLRGRLLLVQPGMHNGRVDALPWLLGTRALFVNRELLRRAGVRHPPTTVSEMLDDCRRLQQTGVASQCIGLAAADPYAAWQQLLSFAWGENPKFLGPSVDAADLRSPELVEAAEAYAALRPYALADRPASIDRQFVEGKLPMVIAGGWLPLLVRDSNADLDYVAAPIPAIRNGSHPFAGGEYLVVSSRSKQQILAREFIEFMLSPAAMATVSEQLPGLLPARVPQDLPPGVPHVDEKTASARRLMAELLTHAATPPPDPAWAIAEPVISSVVDRILLNGESPRVALDAAANALRKLPPSGGSRRSGGIAGNLLLVFEIVVGVALLMASAALAIHRGSAFESTGLMLWLIVFALIYALPAVELVAASATSYDLLSGRASFVGLQQYRNVLADGAFGRSVVVTAVFVVGSVPATLVLSLLTAYGVMTLRSLRGSSELLLYLPAALPAVVTATLLGALFSGGGAIDQIMMMAGVMPPQPPWLVNPHAALLVVIVHAIWTSFGYYTLFFIAALASIPESVMNAAALEGASAWLRFRSIEWPAIRGVAVFVAILQTVRAMQVFPEILVLTRGGPVGATTSVVYYLYEEAFRRFDFGRAAVAATTLMLIIAGCTIPLVSRGPRSSAS